MESQKTTAQNTTSQSTTQLYKRVSVTDKSSLPIKVELGTDGSVRFTYQLASGSGTWTEMDWSKAPVSNGTTSVAQNTNATTIVYNLTPDGIITKNIVTPQYMGVSRDPRTVVLINALQSLGSIFKEGMHISTEVIATEKIVNSYAKNDTVTETVLKTMMKPFLAVEGTVMGFVSGMADTFSSITDLAYMLNYYPDETVASLTTIFTAEELKKLVTFSQERETILQKWKTNPQDAMGYAAFTAVAILGTEGASKLFTRAPELLKAESKNISLRIASGVIKKVIAKDFTGILGVEASQIFGKGTVDALDEIYKNLMNKPVGKVLKGYDEYNLKVELKKYIAKDPVITSTVTETLSKEIAKDSALVALKKQLKALPMDIYSDGVKRFKANNEKLKVWVKELYRKDESTPLFGDGGTADGLRSEIIMKMKISDAGHLSKVNGYINNFEQILRSGTLDNADITLTELLLKDLKSSLEFAKKEGYQ